MNDCFSNIDDLDSWVFLCFSIHHRFLKSKFKTIHLTQGDSDEKGLEGVKPDTFVSHWWGEDGVGLGWVAADGRETSLVDEKSK